MLSDYNLFKIGCGMKIRADDPAAMKDFIVCVQNRANELKASDGDGQEKMCSKRVSVLCCIIKLL